jgi:ATP-binding cassette subfamily B protein/subfamily B ATP-binding cassette protein MsbA
MHNFGRILRIAMRHRLTLVASIGCALVVAVLWTANISAIFPVVEFVMAGDSVPSYLEKWEDTTQEEIEALRLEIAAQEASLAAAADVSNDQQVALAALLDRQARRRMQLSTLQRALPVAQQWLPATAFGTLVAVCGMLFVGTIFKSVFRIAGVYCTARLGHLTDFELRKQFYRRTLRLDLGTFTQTSAGDLMNRFTGDVQVAALGVQAVFGMAIREPLKMIGCLLAAGWVSWRLLLLTLILAPVAGYTIHWLAKALKRANRRALEELSVVYDRLEETISGMKVIKAFGRESRERSRFHLSSKQYYRRSMRIAFYDSLVSPLSETMGVAMIVAAIAAGGYLVLNQQTHLLGIRISDEPLTHGWLTLFYGFLAGASDPVRRLSGVFNGIQRAGAAADHLFELMDRESSVKDPSAPRQLGSPAGPIELHNVSFAYRAAEPVLRNVDLVIHPGETVAVVGPNGCGKSTLINLIPRFYDPTAGVITVGGVDLRDVRRRDIRGRIGMVNQESMLMDDTVGENIRYGRPGATQAQIEQAAHRAHAHRFITEKLVDGYDSYVGPGGNCLSGGQRQRIALARAILRDPEILILDEATSQIDVESERLIHDVLAGFVQDRTAIMITHRPSTLALADRIIVMDHGRIVDCGSYDELAQRCPLFGRLAHLDTHRQSA